MKIKNKSFNYNICESDFSIILRNKEKDEKNENVRILTNRYDLYTVNAELSNI